LTCSGRQRILIGWDAQLEVTVLAPGGSPGVPNLPVLRALVDVVLGVLAVTDDGHSMIDCRGALVAAVAVLLANDAGVIVHQAVGVRMHRDAHWLHGHKGLESVNRDGILLFLIIVANAVCHLGRVATVFLAT